MPIQRVEATHYSIPLPITLSDATHGEMTHFTLVVVRIWNETGAEGLGYTLTTGPGGSAIRTLIEDDLKPILLNFNEDRIESLFNQMWWKIHYAGRGGTTSLAISAVDIALWDLKGHKLATPLWKLLGGHDPKVKAYAGGIDLYFSIDELLEQTEGNLAKGFKAIKIKVGRDNLREDIDRVSAVRNFIGDDIALMIDANMRWRIDEAIRAAKRLADYDIVWLEEPTIPDDIQGHIKIAQEGGLPIATGENFHTLYEFRQMINAGGVQFPEPDITTCGGITVGLKVAHLAEANNLPVTTHGVHDINVHLLAAVPNKSYLETHGFGLDQFITEPLILDENGFAVASERSGHGITFDWENLEDFAI